MKMRQIVCAAMLLIASPAAAQTYFFQQQDDDGNGWMIGGPNDPVYQIWRDDDGGFTAISPSTAPTIFGTPNGIGGTTIAIPEAIPSYPANNPFLCYRQHPGHPEVCR